MKRRNNVPLGPWTLCVLGFKDKEIGASMSRLSANPNPVPEPENYNPGGDDAVVIRGLDPHIPKTVGNDGNNPHHINDMGGTSTDSD